MPLLTGIILALFAGYGLTWYLGWTEGNFPVLLFAAVCVTGVYWLAERFYFLPKRRQQALGSGADNPSNWQLQPWWLDWTAGIFPVLLVVFVLRSFVAEPFKIPSGSMIPTLHVGDLILVNKYHYGIRLPIIHSRITEGQAPQRGDVIVFRYPPQPKLDYIKRVVGIPGDEVRYVQKTLFVNGKPYDKKALPDFTDNMQHTARQFEETLTTGSGSTIKHRILNDDDRASYVSDTQIQDHPHKDLCQYDREGFVCKVPPGHYFMMGDNRDNSEDSRYWGFVPEANIVGKASFIWMNMQDFSRIGSFQ